MKRDLEFKTNHANINVDWITMPVIQSKNGIVMDVGVSKELDNWSSCEQDYMWNLSTCDCECNKAWKINEYLDVGNYFCEKRLIGK